MKKYKVKIEPEAFGDIQDITNWYNEAQAKLGKKFQDTTIAKINRLSKRPPDFRYQISGNQVHAGIEIPIHGSFLY